MRNKYRARHGFAETPLNLTDVERHKLRPRFLPPPRARGRARARAVSAGRTAKPLRAPRGAEVGIDATRRLLPVIGRLPAGDGSDDLRPVFPEEVRRYRRPLS